MPSLAAWFVAANAHLELTDEWPLFTARGTRSSDLTQDLIASGTVYKDWLETLSAPGKGDLLFGDLLDAYGQNWNGDKQARVTADRGLDGQVSREVAKVEERYLEGHDLKNDFPDGQTVDIDLWAGPEQPFDYLLELELINFCSPPIAIKTYNEHYLKAIDGGGRVDNTVDADGTWQGAWEQFRLLDLGDGTHAIQTYNGTFLTAVDGGGRVTDELHTDATHIQSWEKFRLEHLGGNRYAIKTWSGHYVTAVDGGGRSDNAIDTNRTAIGAWETFTFEDVSNAQQLGLLPSKGVLAAFGVPDLFRLAHHLNEEKLTACVERIEPTHERTELAWQVYPIAEYHKYVKPAITLRIKNKDDEVVSVRRITSTNEIWMLAWRQEKDNWLSLEGVLNLWMWGRDNWTQGGNVRAQFETKSVDVPLTAEQAHRLEDLRATLAQRVDDKLEYHIEGLYSTIVSEVADKHSHLFAALNRVSGIKALLSSYALVGLPRSLEGNEYLRALLFGDESLRLLDAGLVKTRYGSAIRDNLALGNPASQSSDYVGATADLAVDGDTSRDFNWGSVTHTNADSPSWWQVDLQGEATVDRIELFNRSDCCGERLKDFDIFACQDEECETRQSITYVEAPVGLNPDPTHPDLVVEANGTTARYLRIQLRQSDFLSLAEVQVIGRMASAYPNMRAQLNEDAEQRLGDLRTQLVGTDGAFNAIASGQVVEGNSALNVTLAALDFRQQTLLSLATSDYYALEAGEDLVVEKGDGLLRNDSTQCAEQYCTVCIGDCDEPSVCPVGYGSTNRQTATVQLETGPDHGTLILDADGGFQYTPDGSFQGFDGFTYRAVYSSDLGQPVISDPVGVVIEVIVTDSDEDGIQDSWEQMYFGSLDRDGTGDADGDRLSDTVEYEQGTNPINDDTDGDGMTDGWEVAHGLDPTADDADGDIDGDGIRNIDEFLRDTDLAVGKPTEMSSYNFGTTGAEAVDGNTSGDWAEGSVTHTHADNPSWWQVDLEHIAWIERVRLFNRTDCCQERLRDFDLMLSEDNETWRSIYVPGPVADMIGIEVGAMARYVRVQLRQVDYLSLAEVVVLGEPATEHGLVFSLPMDEGGDVIVDESGNGYDGILDGAAFVDGGGVLDSGAYAFAWSAADRIFVPYESPQALTEAITVEAWVYPTAWDNIHFGYNRILSKQPVYLLRAENGYPHFLVLTENHGYQGVSGDTLPLNEWHYLVGTFDGSRLALYVDGNLANSLELAAPDRLVTNDVDISIGESPALNEGFTGLIDEVAIYDRARTEAEIRESYKAMGTPVIGQFQWSSLGGGTWGADLVSDGETLYRVGGDFQCHSIYRYDGPSQNSWSLVTDENPQCYSHRSPGEGNRSWYYNGKIVVAGHSHPLHPGGNDVTIYDLASGDWTVHELPVFEHFSWGQAGVLDATTGKLYISWTEEGTTHLYATAALDIATGTWEPTYDRDSKIGRGVVALEDSSGRFVFDLAQGDRYVGLEVYDFQLPTLLPTPDFTGPWLPSSTFDLGPDDFFMNLDWNYGSNVMAWDNVGEKLYLVATKKGTTLSYDPIHDSWQKLESRPEGEAYRDGHVAIAHGRLYSQNWDQLWYMPLR